MLLKYNILFITLIVLSSQLGKSDRRIGVEKDEDIDKPVTEDKKWTKEDLMFPISAITKESILNNHYKVDKSLMRKFSGPALAYVTPWNNKGYDLAKDTAHKLTHISPVWLQIQPEVDDKEDCRILGTHDIDHDWMEALRVKNDKIKIVPRVLFERWHPQKLVKFLANESWSRKCLKNLINFLQRNQLDGAVLEIWTDVMYKTKGEGVGSLIEFITNWGDFFHKKDLQIIIPVGPPLGPDNVVTGVVMPYTLQALAPHVDFIQMMTYDYPSDRPTGVAPYDWIAASLKFILEENPELADHLMIGLNHYGLTYHLNIDKIDTIKFDEYIDILKNTRSRLEFDVVSRDHFVHSDLTLTYYPSLTSLELRIKLAEKWKVGFAIWEYGQGLNYFTQLL